MYKKDAVKRGYNQSIIISKILSKLSQKPIIYDLLIKAKQTRAQIGLPRQERLSNLKNAFCAEY